MLDCARMSTPDIICCPTADTFVRFGIVLAAFFGFGLYFFYDGAIGYREANEVFLSERAFAALGKEVNTMTADEWNAKYTPSTPLLKTVVVDGESMGVQEGGEPLPLPFYCEAAHAMPGEALQYDAMLKSWNECWVAYTGRMHFPVKPGEHGHDMGAIREQWIAGGACMLISLLIAGLMWRTKRRVLSLCGETVTAAGRSFAVSDITRLDLRQWGQGFKGVAYATVNGKKVRMDGMTYGGFSKEKGEPAEQLMKALLAVYKGEVLEYASEDSK